MKHVEESTSNVHYLREPVLINLVDNLNALDLKQELTQTEDRARLTETPRNLQISFGVLGVSVSVIPRHYF